MICVQNFRKGSNQSKDALAFLNKNGILFELRGPKIKRKRPLMRAPFRSDDNGCTGRPRGDKSCD